jgi:hypothetical protein
MNQLMNLVLGRSPDPVSPKAIVNFILTSDWIPDYDGKLKSAIELHGFVRVSMSHPLSKTQEIYRESYNTSSYAEVSQVVIARSYYPSGDTQQELFDSNNIPVARVVGITMKSVHDENASDSQSENDDASSQIQSTEMTHNENSANASKQRKSKTLFNNIKKQAKKKTAQIKKNILHGDKGNRSSIRGQQEHASGHADNTISEEDIRMIVTELDTNMFSDDYDDYGDDDEIAPTSAINVEESDIYDEKKEESSDNFDRCLSNPTAISEEGELDDIEYVPFYW